MVILFIPNTVYHSAHIRIILYVVWPFQYPASYTPQYHRTQYNFDPNLHQSNQSITEPSGSFSNAFIQTYLHHIFRANTYYFHNRMHQNRHLNFICGSKTIIHPLVFQSDSTDSSPDSHFSSISWASRIIGLVFSFFGFTSTH
jgi:hypothetical protein